MKVGAVGYNYKHGEDFVIDHPRGGGCRFMLLIKEPAVFVIGGVRQFAEKNSFIMFSPDMPHSYRARYKTYCDDWLYLDMQPGDLEHLRELGIPENELVHLGSIDELSLLIRQLAYEHYSPLEDHGLIEQHYLEIFLLKLSRALRSRESIPGALSDKRSGLIWLRNTIYASPDGIPDVSGLAGWVGMSRSGLQHLYKKTFGVSLMTDIINGRMMRAKELLSSTDLPIREISQRCGYTNEYGFLKRFKLYFGMTPTQMRESI